MLQFGKPISLENANNQIREFLAVKKDFKPGEFELSAAPEKVKHYYQNAELSFIFEKEILEHVMSTPWCNGLRVYHAITDQVQEGFFRMNTSGKTTIPAGTPTVILVPVTIHADGTVINLVPANDKMIAGGEHPCITPFSEDPNSFDLRSQN